MTFSVIYQWLSKVIKLLHVVNACKCLILILYIFISNSTQWWLATFTYNFALFHLTPTQLVLFPPLSIPTLLSVLWGWEDGGDGCINNAVLPGNQTRCSEVLCRILKRYLFVCRCHPPPPAPLRSPLISSLLPPTPHLNNHPTSVYRSVVSS